MSDQDPDRITQLFPPDKVIVKAVTCTGSQDPLEDIHRNRDRLIREILRAEEFRLNIKRIVPKREIRMSKGQKDPPCVVEKPHEVRFFDVLVEKEQKDMKKEVTLSIATVSFEEGPWFIFSADSNWAK